MILLPIVISLSASKFMKLKSHSEVDLYVFKWHFGQSLHSLHYYYYLLSLLLAVTCNRVAAARLTVA
jgi:hypothetical protein